MEKRKFVRTWERTGETKRELSFNKKGEIISAKERSNDGRTRWVNIEYISKFEVEENSK